MWIFLVGLDNSLKMPFMFLFQRRANRRVMSIRLIAKDLYRLQREVDKLEKELENALGSDRDICQDRLRKAKAERDRIRKILEGTKEPPSTKRPR
jgi:uncharacterized protein (DUF3084 family)